MSPALWAQEENLTTEELLGTIVDTIQVHNTPIEDLLRLLAAQANLNLIIGPDSMGTVSLRFAGVTLKEALNAILQAKGYHYQLYGNIMMVSTPDSLERKRGLSLHTQVFNLKYSDARDIKATIDTAKVLSPWGYTTVYFRSVMINAIKAGSIKPSMELVSRENLNIVEQIETGKMPLQARSDILIVTDRTPNLKRVAELIDLLDQPFKQVEIEVHFVETILTDEQKLGIDWSHILEVGGSYQGRTSWVLGDAGSGGGDVSGVGDEFDPFSDFASTAASSGSNSIELGALASSRFKMILDMMLKQEKAKLLSQPRITTIDHQPASISVGVTTWIEELTGGTGGEMQITYRERQVPIELVVVPHVMASGRLMLELRPRVEEITGWQEGVGGIHLPLISTRVSDSRVEVADGETAVIGGLIKEKTLLTEKRVWLLGSIPLIGHLFRHKVETTQRTDLTIFITPRIIMPGEPLGTPEEDTSKERTSLEKEAIQIGGECMLFALLTGR